MALAIAWEAPPKPVKRHKEHFRLETENSKNLNPGFKLLEFPVSI